MGSKHTKRAQLLVTTICFFLVLLLFSACSSSDHNTTSNDDSDNNMTAEQQQETKTVGDQELDDGYVITRDDVTLKVAFHTPKSSNGAALLLVHQLGQDQSAWDDYVDQFLADGYYIATLDLRGHGDSDGNYQTFEDKQYQYMTYDLQVLRNELLDRGYTDIAIIGASLGANLALTYAANDKAIDALVLLSPGLDYRSLTTLEPVQKYDRPLMMIAAEDDRYAKDSAEKLAKFIADEKVVLVKGAAHGVPLLKSPTTREELREWLQLQFGFI